MIEVQRVTAVPGQSDAIRHDGAAHQMADILLSGIKVHHIGNEGTLDDCVKVVRARFYPVSEQRRI